MFIAIDVRTLLSLVNSSFNESLQASYVTSRYLNYINERINHSLLLIVVR